MSTLGCFKPACGFFKAASVSSLTRWLFERAFFVEVVRLFFSFLPFTSPLLSPSHPSSPTPLLPVPPPPSMLPSLFVAALVASASSVNAFWRMRVLPFRFSLLTPVTNSRHQQALWKLAGHRARRLRRFSRRHLVCLFSFLPFSSEYCGLPCLLYPMQRSHPQHPRRFQLCSLDDLRGFEGLRVHLVRFLLPFLPGLDID
jgi:hypothetical protein